MTFLTFGIMAVYCHRDYYQNLHISHDLENAATAECSSAYADNIVSLDIVSLLAFLNV